MKRSDYRIASLVVLLGLLLSACAAPLAPAPSILQRPTTEPAAPAAPQLTREQQLYETARKEGEVAIWGNTLPSDEAWKPFREKYPGIKVKAWDSSTGADLINKLVEEGKAGRVTADVIFLGAEIVQMHDLGLLQEYEWKAAGWPNQPPHKFYISYAAFAWIPAHNTNVIPVEQGPKSWEDLALPKWRDKAPVTSFSGPEIPFYMAHLWREDGKLNWAKSEKFLTDLVTNNKPKVVRGFTGPFELLATGEYGIFLPHSSSSSLLIMLAQGAPIAPVPVGKAPAYNRSMGIAKNPAHPNAAKLFADWFTAESGNLSVIEAQMAYALDPEIAKAARANRLLAEKYKIEVDVVPWELFTGENLKRARDFWFKLLGMS